MTILGDPIPCSGRPDWLRDDDVCAVEWRNWQGSTDAIPARHWTTWPNITDLRLPADHPVYAIIKAGLPLYTREAGGWRPWFGEREWPGDYGGEVCWQNGQVWRSGQADNWDWLYNDSNTEIIAYLAKPAEEISPNASIPAPDSPETQPEDITLATAISVIESHGYASVQRRTFDEWEEWSRARRDAYRGVEFGGFYALGLVLPDPVISPTALAARAIADGTATDEQRAFYDAGRAGR